jgi:hypothetical protein
MYCNLIIFTIFLIGSLAILYTLFSNPLKYKWSDIRDTTKAISNPPAYDLTLQALERKEAESVSKIEKLIKERIECGYFELELGDKYSDTNFSNAISLHGVYFEDVIGLVKKHFVPRGFKLKENVKKRTIVENATEIAIAVNYNNSFAKVTKKGFKPKKVPAAIEKEVIISTRYILSWAKEETKTCKCGVKS